MWLTVHRELNDSGNIHEVEKKYISHIYMLRQTPDIVRRIQKFRTSDNRQGGYEVW